MAISLIAVGGCVPVVTKYPKFDVAGAIYIHEPGLGKLSPPIMIYYPFHGIHVSFDLHGLVLGLHVPAGTVVQLNDTRIQINSATGSGRYDATFAIRAAPHKWTGGARQFLALPDPYTTSDNFGPLVGAGDGENIAWYLFVVMNPQDPRRLERTPKGLINGTVVLPSLTINGQHYDAQRLSFTQKTFAGLECINC